MATTRKILGKFNPAAATDQIQYTVPASTGALVNLFITNQTAVATTFRAGVVFTGVGVNWTLDALAFDVTLPGNSFVQIPGIALGPDEDLITRSASGTVSFVAMGMEDAQ